MRPCLRLATALSQSIIARVQSQIEALQKRLAANQTSLDSPALEAMESETAAPAADAVAALEARVSALEVSIDTRLNSLLALSERPSGCTSQHLMNLLQEPGNGATLTNYSIF